MGSDVQDRLRNLEANGWTLAGIARELGHTPNAVQKWKAGDRTPANLKATLDALDALAKRRRVPKKKVYLQTSTETDAPEATRATVQRSASGS